MTESIITALITGGLTLMGVLAANNKQQAITDTKLDELTREVREHKKLHKPLDKCGFPSAHRSYNTHIDLSARPRLDILVYMEMIHKNTPSHILLQCMREGDILYRQSLFLRRSTEKYRLLQGLF